MAGSPQGPGQLQRRRRGEASPALTLCVLGSVRVTANLGATRFLSPFTDEGKLAPERQQEAPGERVKQK